MWLRGASLMPPRHAVTKATAIGRTALDLTITVRDPKAPGSAPTRETVPCSTAPAARLVRTELRRTHARPMESPGTPTARPRRAADRRASRRIAAGRCGRGRRRSAARVEGGGTHG